MPGSPSSQLRAKYVYVADPMCSWCWGFERALNQLRESCPLPLEFVLGGLAPDNDQPMAADMRAMIADNWKRVEEVTGASFNWDYWERAQPCRSTWPACRLMLAAELESRGGAERAYGAIQRAYYRDARDPSQLEVLLQIGTELGLERARLAGELDGANLRALHRAHRERMAELGARGFPTLFLEIRPVRESEAEPAGASAAGGALTPGPKRYLLGSARSTGAELIEQVSAIAAPLGLSFESQSDSCG